MAIAAPTPQPFEHLLLDFLAYLEFERGLSRNTLEAYRSDLLQLGTHLKRTGADALTATHSDLADFVSDLAAGSEERPPVAPPTRPPPCPAPPPARGGGGPPAGLARHAPAQGRVPAVVLPPPAAPGPG